MKMPNVAKCSVTKCAYNQGDACHALAITVGNGNEPKCDTFLSNAQKGGDSSTTGKVGACKVSVCKFNEKLECQADRIEVALKSDIAYCTTFTLD